MKDIYKVLYLVRRKYKSLGLQIGVKKSEIENIEAQHRDRLFDVLSGCVKEVEILDIEAALRSHSVCESTVANAIRRKYGHLFSPCETTSEDDEMHMENTL